MPTHHESLKVLTDRVQESGTACPDCCADVRLDHDDDRVFRLTVLHDPTCPVLRAHDKRTAARRQGRR